ncbi:MAG: L,D-transpeptidase [Ilumatobacteraceae bacterium]
MRRLAPLVASALLAGAAGVLGGARISRADDATTTTSTSTTSTSSTTTSTTTTVPATSVPSTSSTGPVATTRLRYPAYSRVSPPALPPRSGDGRRVVYSNRLQWVWVVDRDGTVVRAMPVSGRRGVPEAGAYRVTSQSPKSFSLDFDGVWFDHMTRFAFGPDGGNVGFHAIPRQYGKVMQTEEQLGTFQGSGCVRMAPEDARFVYRWARPGTPVVVVP